MDFRAPQLAATAIDKAFLSRGMEARAHNLDQYNPSAAVDSQLERIRALALRLPPSPECEALMAEVESAILSNRLEGEQILGISADADRLVADLHRIGRRPGHRGLGVQSIARALRGPLALIASPDGVPVGHLVTARRQVTEIVESTPQLMLLSTSVEYELGQKKFAALVSLAQNIARNESGAERSAAAGATEERGAAPHGQL